VSDRPFAGEVANIGAGDRTDLVQLAHMMAEALGVPHLKPVFQPARAGDVKHSLADLSRARDLLGYQPIVPMAEGLRATVDWYRQMLPDRVGGAEKKTA
jgi:nucleoside-diphosphate-sugar epimerase